MPVQLNIHDFIRYDEYLCILTVEFFTSLLEKTQMKQLFSNDLVVVKYYYYNNIVELKILQFKKFVFLLSDYKTRTSHDELHFHTF